MGQLCRPGTWLSATVPCHCQGLYLQETQAQLHSGKETSEPAEVALVMACITAASQLTCSSTSSRLGRGVPEAGS